MTEDFAAGWASRYIRGLDAYDRDDQILLLEALQQEIIRRFKELQTKEIRR